MLEVVEQGQAEENDVRIGDEKEDRMRKRAMNRNQGKLCGEWW